MAGIYLDGHVVIPRRIDGNHRARRRAKIPAAQFTLHRAECFYARRATTAQAAPINPYPGTIACQYCRPITHTPEDNNAE